MKKNLLNKLAPLVKKVAPIAFCGLAAGVAYMGEEVASYLQMGGNREYNGYI